MRLLLTGLLLGPLAFADGLPYPPGSSEQEIEGSRTALLIPDGLGPDKPASLVLLLHGNGDTGPGLVHVLRDWPAQGYVVCAPSATGGNWDDRDLDTVRRIAAHLLQVLPIDPERIHCVGFSNGGWNLGPIAFDEDLKPLSATWVAAGFRGGKVPRWARKMGVLALAGADDPNAGAARETVSQLADKVRAVEVRLQDGLGHKWPDTFTPYMLWWMGVQEGRFTPGDDRNFDWGDDVAAALEALKGQKKGGVFVYVYAEADAEKPEAKELQRDVFSDLFVRHYGRQLQAVKLPFAADNPYGVKATPAVVVLDKEGKTKKVLAGKIKAKSLASALRSVAPDKKQPPD